MHSACLHNTMEKGNHESAAVQAMIAEMVVLREREAYLKKRIAVGNPCMELIIELEQVTDRLDALYEVAEQWGPFDLPT